MEVPDTSSQAVEIDDPNIPQYPNLIALEVPADNDVTTQISTLAT